MNTTHPKHLAPQDKTRTRCACGLAICAGLLVAASLHAAEPLSSAQEQAQRILKETGVTGGLVVHIGCSDPATGSAGSPQAGSGPVGKLTAALRASDAFVVQGLETDPEKVSKVRKIVQDAGLYGPVSVANWSGDALPYVDNLVRLLVISDTGKLSRAEIERVLCPGGWAYSLHPSSLIPQPFQKPWPKEIDEWQQHYKGADNNAVSKDERVGPPRRFQWINSPHWQRSHLALPSINSLVSAGGRLYSVEDRASAEIPSLPGKFALVCRDAFSGIELWEQPFPDWQPVNIYVKMTPAQLQRRLVATADKIYCTPGITAPITVFDAKTGDKLSVISGTERTQEFCLEDGMIFAVIGDPTDTDAPGNYTKGGLQSGQFPEHAYGPIFRKIERPICDVAAFDAQSGKERWRKTGKDTEGYAGTTLAVINDVAVYSTTNALVCLDKRSGAEQWRVPVVTIMEQPTPLKYQLWKGIPGLSQSLVLSSDTVYLADAKILSAYDLKTGEKRWEGKTFLNHVKSADVFVVGDKVWTMNKRAYEAKTGQSVTTLTQKMTGPMSHDRCYRNRITEKWYINSVTGGSDFLGLDGSGEFPNPWIRATCGVGFLPANGLFYAGPPACSCCLEVMLNNFNAMTAEPELGRSDQVLEVAVEPVLLKGEAYRVPVQVSGSPASPAEARIREQAWPSYRCDMARSGHTPTAVNPKLTETWRSSFRNVLTQPTIAGGKVFVAEIDAHTVHALDAHTGKARWSFTAGGRIDSPPTLIALQDGIASPQSADGRHGVSPPMLAVFGSHDGWVYALNADSGALAWRFKALPERTICAFEQLESAWPVHGSVLVKDGIAYFSAGRNSFTDGGIFLFGLNAATGELVHQGRLHGPYGDNGFPVIRTKQEMGGFGLVGNMSDILLTDGDILYMRHQPLKPDLTVLTVQDATKPHLIAHPGFTETIGHHRSFWTIDTSLHFDIPTGNKPSHGDILVMDESRFFEIRGYQPGRQIDFNPRNGFSLVAGTITTNGVSAPKVLPKGKRIQKEAGQWMTDIAFTGKALVWAGDTLFAAGVPLKFPEDDLHKAIEGRMGGVLCAFSIDNGEKLAEYKLGAPPAWDGMATAAGHIYISLADGTLMCLGQKTAIE